MIDIFVGINAVVAEASLDFSFLKTAVGAEKRKRRRSLAYQPRKMIDHRVNLCLR